MRLIASLAPAVLLALLSAACAKPPPVDSYCAHYQRKDFKDPALRRQNRHNRNADRTNERTADRLGCPP